MLPYMRIDAAINAVVHVHSDRAVERRFATNCHDRRDIAYGTPDMAKEFSRLYRESDLQSTGIAVMGGHESGLISIGSSMKEAATRILDLARGMKPRSRSGFVIRFVDGRQLKR